MGVVITVVLLLRQSIEIAFLTIDFRVRPLLSLRAGLWVWFFALRHSRLAHYRHWNPVFVVSLANVVQAFHPTQLGLSSKNLGLITQHVIFLSETMLSQHYYDDLPVLLGRQIYQVDHFFQGFPETRDIVQLNNNSVSVKDASLCHFPSYFISVHSKWTASPETSASWTTACICTNTKLCLVSFPVSVQSWT